jgi:hypothetical protein
MTIWMLVLVACLGRDCRHFEQPVLSCAIGGQVDMIAWKDEHPGWVVRYWSCLPGREA